MLTAIHRGLKDCERGKGISPVFSVFSYSFFGPLRIGHIKIKIRFKKGYIPDKAYYSQMV